MFSYIMRRCYWLWWDILRLWMKELLYVLFCWRICKAWVIDFLCLTLWTCFNPIIWDFQWKSLWFVKTCPTEIELNSFFYTFEHDLFLVISWAYLFQLCNGNNDLKEYVVSYPVLCAMENVLVINSSLSFISHTI